MFNAAALFLKRCQLPPSMQCRLEKEPRSVKAMQEATLHELCLEAALQELTCLELLGARTYTTLIVELSTVVAHFHSLQSPFEADASGSSSPAVAPLVGGAAARERAALPAPGLCSPPGAPQGAGLAAGAPSTAAQGGDEDQGGLEPLEGTHHEIRASKGN